MRKYENRIKRLEKKILPHDPIIMIIGVYGFKGLPEDNPEKCPQYREQLKTQKGMQTQIFHIRCDKCDERCEQNLPPVITPDVKQPLVLLDDSTG